MDQVDEKKLGMNFFPTAAAATAGITSVATDPTKGILNIDFMNHSSTSTIIKADVLAWGKG